MNQSWLPNWTDKSPYPNVNGTPSLQWAWEFLRRNDQYQRLWDKLIAPTHDATKFDDAWKVFQQMRRGPGIRPGKSSCKTRKAGSKVVAPAG
jgi:hypothetical protein